MRLLPNPWDGPIPESDEQPKLLVSLRYFRSLYKACYAGTYPYKHPKGKPGWVAYYEMLGHGPPPKDVAAHPGDLYVDVDLPILVYVRGLHHWEQWNQRPQSNGRVKKVPVAAHPILAGRYLWKVGRSNNRVLSWVSEATMRLAGFDVRTARIDPTQGLESLFRDAEERIKVKGERGSPDLVHLSTHENTFRSERINLRDPSGSISEWRIKTRRMRRRMKTDLESEEESVNDAQDDDGTVADLSDKVTAFIQRADEARLVAQEKAQSLEVKLNNGTYLPFIGEALAELQKEKKARATSDAIATDLKGKYAREKGEHTISKRNLETEIVRRE
ncbi:hypothetical protein H0H81_001792 [Sphagnurus paluster]|uniref:Uncharacterized protein n=1 Tax=Sphagnurus paluster TaxID=117069 RepID=A0A9P7K6G9_9AGAR|nr:hypothetical protein H0H81_001792 [Sphagnurus paluster]